MARDLTSVHTNESALLHTGKIRLLGVLYTSGGGQLEHINIYDATSATGSVKLELDTTKQGVVDFRLPEGGMNFANGVYCDIGGATSVTVLLKD
jgi:hypothetical protein